MEQIEFGSDTMECKNSNSANVLVFLFRIFDSHQRENSGKPTLDGQPQNSQLAVFTGVRVFVQGSIRGRYAFTL